MPHLIRLPVYVTLRNHTLFIANQSGLLTSSGFCLDTVIHSGRLHLVFALGVPFHFPPAKMALLDFVQMTRGGDLNHDLKLSFLSLVLGVCVPVFAFRF